MSKPTDLPTTLSTQKSKPAISLSRPFDTTGLPERPLPIINGQHAEDEPLASPGIDLAGKPKVWFVIGRGRIGKTTVIRWAAEAVNGRGGQAIYAAADPINRSLRAFLEEVAEPPTDDPNEVAAWLHALIAYAMEEKMSALVDLGGGDTSLGRLLRQMPDLAQIMEQSGVTPVAIHVLGTDEHDLTPLAAMEAAGFQPRATALILNEMTGSRPEFARVENHSVFLAAKKRGAVVVRMPKLAPAAIRIVDAKGLTFTAATEALGLLNGAPVRVWLQSMARQFGPITTWLP
jgi:hypothetical protein